MRPGSRRGRRSVSGQLDTDRDPADHNLQESNGAQEESDRQECLPVAPASLSDEEATSEGCQQPSNSM